MKIKLNIVKCCSNCKNVRGYIESLRCSLLGGDTYETKVDVNTYHTCDKHVFYDLACLNCNFFNEEIDTCERTNTAIHNAFDKCKLGHTFEDIHTIK